MGSHQHEPWLLENGNPKVLTREMRHGRTWPHCTQQVLKLTSQEVWSNSCFQGSMCHSLKLASPLARSYSWHQAFHSHPCHSYCHCCWVLWLWKSELFSLIAPFNLSNTCFFYKCSIAIWGHESQDDSGMLPTIKCFLPSWNLSPLHQIIRIEDTIQLLKLNIKKTYLSKITN